MQHLAHAKYLININFFLLITIILILSQTVTSWGCPPNLQKGPQDLSSENSIMFSNKEGEKGKGGGEVEESSYNLTMSHVYSSKKAY